MIVNPTVPVGPGDLGQSPPTQMILNFCHGGRREYLDAELNLIDVRDVAEGMVLAMDAAGRGVATCSGMRICRSANYSRCWLA